MYLLSCNKIVIRHTITKHPKKELDSLGLLCQQQTKWNAKQNVLKYVDVMWRVGVDQAHLSQDDSQLSFDPTGSVGNPLKKIHKKWYTMRCCSRTIVRKHSDLEEIMKHLNKYFTTYHQMYKRTQSFGRMFF